jgi:hypothetical protein
VSSSLAKRVIDGDGDVADDDSSEASELGMRKFVELVEVAETLMARVAELCDAAHFCYRNCRLRFGGGVSAIETMRATANHCATRLESWTRKLAEVRTQHHIMQCFYGRQIVVLLDWLCETGINPFASCKESEGLMRFASPFPWQPLHNTRRARLCALRERTKSNADEETGNDAEVALSELAECLSIMFPPSTADHVSSQEPRNLSVPAMSVESRRAMVVTVPPGGNIISAIGALLYETPKPCL